MAFIGETITLTSEKTGRAIKKEFVIANCFPTNLDFQKFLIEMYMEDFGFYKLYSQLLTLYLKKNPDELDDIELTENLASLSTIDAMYLVRDIEHKKLEAQAHREMQRILNNILKQK